MAPNGKRRMLQRLEKEFVSVLLSMTDTLQFDEIQKTQCVLEFCTVLMLFLHHHNNVTTKHNQ